jgi:hypothetical protein
VIGAIPVPPPQNDLFHMCVCYLPTILLADKLTKAVLALMRLPPQVTRVKIERDHYDSHLPREVIGLPMVSLCMRTYIGGT